jgi:WD40 repeat protein
MQEVTDPSAPVRTLMGHTDWVTCLCFSHDNKYLATGSQDRTVCVWDLQDINDGMADPQLRGDSSDVRGCDGGAMVRAPSRDRATAMVIAVDVHGEPSAPPAGFGAADADVDLQGLVEADLGSPAGGQQAATSRAVSSAVADGPLSNSVAHTISAGNACAVGDVQPEPRSPHARVPIHKLEAHYHAVVSVGFNKDSSLLITASIDRIVKIWDMAVSPSLKHTLTACASSLSTHTSRELFAVSLSPEGLKLVTACGDTLQMWSVETGMLLCILRGHESEVCAAAWSHDGVLVASGGTDKSVRVWDTLCCSQVRIEQTTFLVLGICFVACVCMICVICMLCVISPLSV